MKPGSAAMEFVKTAAEDAYDRLIFPSLEREMRTALTEKARSLMHKIHQPYYLFHNLLQFHLNLFYHYKQF